MITICKCGGIALGKMGRWPREYLIFKCDRCGLVFTEYERDDKDRSKEGLNAKG